MKRSTFMVATMAASLAAIGYGASAFAAVSADEAKQLGRNLTQFGAEKAGNKEGTIPEYTGGLATNTAPPGFKPDSGKWVNPYASEKPQFSITGQNMDKYGDKLSEATKALLKRYPSFRLDVYPTHRSVNYPKAWLDKTVANATAVTTRNNGETVSENAVGGLPFPIPKTGYEAMWNFQFRYAGGSIDFYGKGYYVDGAGKLVKSGAYKGVYDYPYGQPGVSGDEYKKNGAYVFRANYRYTYPSRVNGDSNLILETNDPVERPNKVWIYSASTRRIRLAPDFFYDAPFASTAGTLLYDMAALFKGRMDRFDFKLVGKKEIYLPYHTYDMNFNVPSDKLLTPNHPNPDFMRWELHRAWVVQADLKPGMRHVLHKRVFFMDEDWGGVGTADEYDSSGKIYKGNFALAVPLYDKQVNSIMPTLTFDLAIGAYCHSSYFGEDAWLRSGGWQPDNVFTQDSLIKRSAQ